MTGLLPTLAGHTSANGSEGLQVAAGTAPSSVISDFSQLGNTDVPAAANSVIAAAEQTGALHPGLPLAAAPEPSSDVSDVISRAASAAAHQGVDTVASRVAAAPNALHLAAPTASSSMTSGVIHSAAAAQLAERAPANSISHQSGALFGSVPVAALMAPASSSSDLTHIGAAAEIRAATTAPSSIVSGITDLALPGGLAQQPDSAADIDPGAVAWMRAATTAPSSIVSGITDLVTAGRVAQHADGALDGADDIAPDGADAATMRHQARYVLAA